MFENNQNSDVTIQLMNFEEVMRERAERDLMAGLGRLSRLQRWEGDDLGSHVAVVAFQRRLDAAWQARQQNDWYAVLDRLSDGRKALLDLAPQAPQ